MVNNKIFKWKVSRKSSSDISEKRVFLLDEKKLRNELIEEGEYEVLIEVSIVEDWKDRLD